jgi:hypothetical protein
MDHDQICSWLQVPNGNWPPDHYTLLGLPPGESDIARIEQHVHERMEKVRVYQLTNPDPATEAMNRLAQALICLTDPHAKKAYDQKLFPERFAEPEPPPVRRVPSGSRSSRSLAWLFGRSSVPEPPTEPHVNLDWETTPPPQRLPIQAETPTLADAVSETTSQPVAPTPPSVDAAGSGQPMVDTGAPQPAAEPASNQANWRKGLGTRRALHYRLIWQRQLLWAWHGAGKYLNRSNRTLHRPAEATELIHHLQSIRELLKAFPLFGVANPPGYLVMGLASQPMIVPTFQTLLPSQRQAMARDWQAGLKVLQAHRQFLRQELRALKRRGSWRQALRALQTGLVANPGIVVLVIACLALNVSYEKVRERWLEQLLGLLTLVVVRIIFSQFAASPIRKTKPRPARPPVSTRKPVRRKLPNSSRA